MWIQLAALMLSAAPDAGVLDEKACELAAKALRVVSVNERAVPRKVFESDWLTCTANAARIVPSMKDGKLVGIRLFSIRPESVWAAAGFMNGDVLKEANGLPLLEPEQVYEATQKLRHAERLEITVERQGAPAKLIIVVEPAPKRGK
ncbi:MAG: hypothetical protein JNM17_23720 [Archangium sp.]|nr:hypothetical protein [Archangium sp.]